MNFKQRLVFCVVLIRKPAELLIKTTFTNDKEVLMLGLKLEDGFKSLHSTASRQTASTLQNLKNPSNRLYSTITFLSVNWCVGQWEVNSSAELLTYAFFFNVIQQNNLMLGLKHLNAVSIFSKPAAFLALRSILSKTKNMWCQYILDSDLRINIIDLLYHITGKHVTVDTLNRS